MSRRELSPIDRVVSICDAAFFEMMQEENF